MHHATVRLVPFGFERNYQEEHNDLCRNKFANFSQEIEDIGRPWSTNVKMSTPSLLPLRRGIIYICNTRFRDF